jgi:hypothetical protein
MLNPQDVATIQKALADGRSGSATLEQLARAHSLAEKACLNGSVGELRLLIHNATPKPIVRTEGKEILMGIGAGIITHFLMKKFDRS